MVVLAVVVTPEVAGVGLDQLEAEPVSGAVELALAARASQVEAGVSRVELEWYRSGRTRFLDRAGQQIVARCFQTSHAIVARSLRQGMLREHFSNAD